MKKIKVGVFGAGGRMGKEICQILETKGNCHLFYPVIRGEVLDAKKISAVDVWIDFSNPEAFPELLKIAKKHNTPIVCGTTGFSAKEYVLMKKYSKDIPILWSSNMSLGIAVLNQAIKSLSAVAHFDFQVEEFHHIRKKDKPSGTAITLQNNLKKVVKKELPEPLAIRGGGIFGIHKVFAMSEEEIITFEHNALNRTVFARGAILAAEWIVNKKAGIYEIGDVFFGGQK